MVGSAVHTLSLGSVGSADRNSRFAKAIGSCNTLSAGSGCSWGADGWNGGLVCDAHVGFVPEIVWSKMM